MTCKNMEAIFDALSRQSIQQLLQGMASNEFYRQQLSNPRLQLERQLFVGQV